MFLAFAILTLAGALSVLWQRNLILAGMSLVLSFLGLAGLFVLLANPGIAISTAEVYRACSGVLTSERNSYTILHSALPGGDVTVAARGLFNGLEAGVFLKYPAVGRVAQLLKAAGAPGVLLSGSGASVFALVEDVGQGERIRRVLPGDCWSCLTWTLPDGVMAAHGFLEP